MAAKNIEFTERLEKTIAETGLDYKPFAKKAEIKYTTLMNYLVPGSRGRVPKWDQLIKIAASTNKSIDWFLTGKNPAQIQPTWVAEPQAQYKSEEKFMSQWPKEIRTACRQVRAILLSNHKMIKDALLSNLLAFQRLKSLEEQDKAKKNTDTGADASSSTGKPET